MAYELSADITATLSAELKEMVSKPEVLAVFETVTTGLVNSKTALQNEKAALKAMLDGFGGSEKVKADLAELTNLRAMTEEEKKKAALAHKDVDAVRTDLGGKLQAREQELSALRETIAKREVSGKLGEAITKAGGDADLLQPFVTSRIKHTIKADGSVGIEVLRADGTPMSNDNGDAAALSDLMTEFKNSDKYSKLFAASNIGGAGTPGAKGALGVGNNPFDKKSPNFNVTEQSRLYKTNPVLAKQLAAQVGITLK